MKQLIFFCLIIGSFMACETEGFQTVDEQPVFEFITELNGDEFVIQAGLNGVENKPSFDVQNNVYNYVSSFSIPATASDEYRKLNLHFKQFPKVTNLNASEQSVFNNSLDYMLSFTGIEGISLMPNTGGISDPFVTAWTIDGKPVSTQVNPLVPLPILREQGFVDVQYSLNIQNKFRGIMNSRFTLEEDKSCHGTLDIIKAQDQATLSFTASNNSLNDVEWNTGETESSIDINYEAQTIVMDASSSDCSMSLQLEIVDPTSLPDALSYDMEEMTGPATSLPYHGFVVELISITGEIFRSDYGIQNSLSNLSIESVEDFGLDINGNPALKVSGLMDARLYNLAQDQFIDLENGQVSFAFSHPAN